MTTARILPLGFIDRATENGAIIMLTSPSESATIELNTPVTLHAHSQTGPPAAARARGLITSVGYVTATFRTVESIIDPEWPSEEPVLRRGIPVYQAIPDSYLQDPARTLTREQQEGLRRIAARYEDITRPKRR